MSKTLSVEQAARVIFRRVHVQTGDIAQVRSWLTSGDLYGRRVGPEQWRITEDAIADFMACEADPAALEINEKAKAGHSVLATQDATSRSELVRSYRQAARDYFLDVITRRKGRYASKNWNLTVLAGQFAIVATGILLFVWSVVQFDISVRGGSPRVQLVNQWLESKYDGEYRVETISETTADPSDGGIVLAVKYRYPSKHRGWIQTEQFFVVRDDKIVDVTSEL